MILEWIRFIIGSLFIIMGLLMTVLAVCGVYRFSYVLNRMHPAALVDVAGVPCLLIGLMLYAGRSVMTARFLLIIVLFWLTSPVSAHMIAKIELLTNEKAGEAFEVTKL